MRPTTGLQHAAGAQFGTAENGNANGSRGSVVQPGIGLRVALLRERKRMSGGHKRAKVRKVLKAWGRGIKRMGIARISWGGKLPASGFKLPGSLPGTTGTGPEIDGVVGALDGSTGAEPAATLPERDRRFGGVPFKRVYTEDALRSRRQWASQTTSADLSALAADTQPPADLFRGNIESHIGFVQVPVGVAGPLLVHGEHAQGAFYVPMATTEGALVASSTRGMRAVSESGGAKVRVVSDKMMRAPMFTFESLTEAVQFVEWVKENDAQLKGIASSQSRVGRLTHINPVILGDTVCLQLSYFTGDAYGANMVMKCSWALCHWTLLEFPRQTGLAFLDWYVDSQLGAEKKVNAMTYTTSMRGKRVVAEVHLKRDVMKTVLKVTPEDLFEALVAGLAPNMASGMLGCNVNFANSIASIFTATGQDIATVPESCQGQINFRMTHDGMYFGALLPNLVVATIGGGTMLPSQKACLELLGCSGTGKAKKLAEIVTAAAMALDISTYAAIAADHFVQAHEKLGRNRPRTGPLTLPPGMLP